MECQQAKSNVKKKIISQGSASPIAIAEKKNNAGVIYV